MGKTIEKIIQSKYPPNSTNVLWDDGENLKIVRNGSFENVVSTMENTGNLNVEVTVDNTTGTPSVNTTVEGSTIKLAFSGLKGETGPQGNSGYQGAEGELEVVNNLIDGGESAALSAEQGKVLKEELTELPVKSNQFIIDAKIANWRGVGKNIKVTLIYRNDASYGSGIMLKDESGNQVAYIQRLQGERNGIETLEITTDYGVFQLLVNWDIIPNGYNQSPDEQILLPYSAFGNELETTKELLLTQEKVESTITDVETLKPNVEKINQILFYEQYGVDAFKNVGYIYPSGGIGSISGWHYTDLMPLDGIEKLHTENLEYENKYIAVLAFYDAEKSLLSTISNVGSGLVEYDIDVPDGAAYFRATSTDKISATNSPLIQAWYRENKLEQLGYIKEDVEAIKPRLAQVEQKTSTDIIELGENDADWFKSIYQSKGLGQYYYNGEDVVLFNQIVLRGLDLLSNDSVEYRIYIANIEAIKTNGAIKETTHSLIAEGVLSKKGVGYQDYNILLKQGFSLPLDKGVVIYIIGTEKSQVKQGALPEGVVDANRLLFALNPSWDGNWSLGSGNSYYGQSLHIGFIPYFITRLEYQQNEEKIINSVKKELPSLVDKAIGNNLEIVIPNIVYAFEGLEMNIWNDTISLSIDNGLYSPSNYKVRWFCSKGLVTERGFRFTPTSADVGEVNCTCYIYDVRGALITSKTFVIRVLGKSALSASKKIAYFGDSLGSSVAAALYGNFNDTQLFGGVIPTMVGTRGTSNKYDAVGGYGWSNYATEGEKCFRASVSGIASLSVGARYKDANNNAFEVKEVNMTDGNGNILLYKWYSNGQYGYSDLQLPSGTLSKISGSGDSSVPYTNAFKESTNPLWNATSNKLDVAQYKTLCGLANTDKIDAVSFQFGINDDDLADDTEKLYSYIKALYNAFIGDNPSCKFIVGLTTTSGNTLNGCGANYGASSNWKSYQENVYKIRKYYLSLLDDSTMPNLRIATPHLYLDRYYGYGFSTRQVSARYAETEKYHNNFVHPTSSGYAQMADAYLAAFVAALIE